MDSLNSTTLVSWDDGWTAGPPGTIALHCTPARTIIMPGYGLGFPRLQAVLASTQSWDTLSLTFMDLGQV